MPRSDYQLLYRRRAERVAQLLAGLPFIRLVGLNGSLARDEARPESDIDFLIITTPSRMYTVRFLASLLVHLLGLRRYGRNIAGRICLNRFQTTDQLIIEPQNTYHAEVFSRLIPLIDLYDTYLAYQLANSWMTEQFGLPIESPKRRRSRSLWISQWTRRFGEWLLGGWLGDRIEDWLRRLQVAKIKRHHLFKRYPDRIQVGENMLLFHPPAAGEVDDDLARWDAAAEEYNLLQGTLGDPFRRSLLDPVILKYLGPITGQRLLDAGCGNGYLTHRLSEAGATVIGIDGSAVMIARAKQNFPTCDFRVTDLNYPLPFPDQHFAAIVSSMVLHALADPMPTLREFRRIIKPAGRLVVAIPHPAFAYPAGQLRRTFLGWLTGRPPELVIQDYQSERRVTVSLAGMAVPTNRYHRPLARYFTWFQESGWRIKNISEPTGVLGNERLRRRLPITETIPLAIIFQLSAER